MQRAFSARASSARSLAPGNLSDLSPSSLSHLSSLSRPAGSDIPSLFLLSSKLDYYMIGRRGGRMKKSVLPSLFSLSDPLRMNATVAATDQESWLTVLRLHKA